MNLHRTVSLGMLVVMLGLLAGCIVEERPAYYDHPHRMWYGDEYHGWHEHRW